MPVKVSVIVPVYNPGRRIDACIASLLGQSLPAAEYEVIFVDDGSTDGTGAVLDELAASRENVKAIHIPNSGWPGRPRNIGTDAAQGEFVYYVDNDDWVGEQALERMYDAACRFQSDVLIGKVVGHGKPVPKEIFRSTKERADIFDDALLTLQTPAKLFRRSFLSKYGIRYPEGKTRLEDHYFVIQAYLQAEVISVLASYPCYHWMEHGAANVSSRRGLDPRVYYDALCRVLDIVDEHVPPGPDRDRFYAHWYRSKILQKLGGKRIITRHLGFGGRRYAVARATALDRMAPSVDKFLTPPMRVRSALLRADRPNKIFALRQAERAMRAEVRLDDMSWQDGALCLQVTGRLRYGDGTPVRFESDGDRLCWQVPASVGTPLPLEVREVGTSLANSRLDVLVKDREHGWDYLLPIEVEQIQMKLPDGTTELSFRGEARLDPMTATAGEPLNPGVWDLTARVLICGLSGSARLGAEHAERVEAAATPQFFEPPVDSLRPYWTAAGNLSVEIGNLRKALRHPGPARPKPKAG